MAKVMKKAQGGADVPKGMVRGEMTGKLIKKADQDKWEAGMADALDKQAGKGKYAPKPKGSNFDKKSFDKLPSFDKFIKKNESKKSAPKAKAGKMIKKAAKKK